MKLPDESVAASDALSPAIRLAKLRWRCRRGMRELDELLQRYLERRYPYAQEIERQAFESLVELQDPTLLSYLLGHQTPTDAELQHVISRVTEAGYRCT